MKDIFQWEFVVLLADVAMVVTYFVLVRSVDFQPGRERYVASEPHVAWLVLIIFALYLFWDIVTKMLLYWLRPRYRTADQSWFGYDGPRMVPTVICLLLAWWMWKWSQYASGTLALTMDFGLFSLVILFRALKSLASAVFPRKDDAEVMPHRFRWPIFFSALSALATVGSILAVGYSLAW